MGQLAHDAVYFLGVARVWSDFDGAPAIGGPTFLRRLPRNEGLLPTEQSDTSQRRHEDDDAGALHDETFGHPHELLRFADERSAPWADVPEYGRFLYTSACGRTGSADKKATPRASSVLLLRSGRRGVVYRLLTMHWISVSIHFDPTPLDPSRNEGRPPARRDRPRRGSRGLRSASWRGGPPPWRWRRRRRTPTRAVP